MDKLSWNAASFRRYATFALVLICLALFGHEIFGPHGFLALRREKQEIENLRQQISQLKHENEQLDKRIKALQSDPEAIERVAREQMRLVRPGEIVYNLPEKDQKTDQAPSSALDTSAK